MSTYTQKHYEQIGVLLRDVRRDGYAGEAAVNFITNRFVDLFAEDSPRFKRTMFIDIVLGVRPISTEETGREEQPNE